jgi:hypothetical protein
MKEVRSRAPGLRLFIVLGLTAAAGALAAPPSAQADPPCGGRYTISPDGTVLDNDTKLTWQQAVDTTARNWDAADVYCQQLSLAGGGFRLPTSFELQTLVDEVKAGTGPMIDTQAFPAGPYGVFWSSPAGSSISAPRTSWPRKPTRPNPTSFAACAEALGSLALEAGGEGAS